MGSFKDKAKGTFDKVTGNVKEGVGKMTGNENLEAEGQVQQGEGNVHNLKGDVKNKTSDAIDKVEKKIRRAG